MPSLCKHRLKASFSWTFPVLAGPSVLRYPQPGVVRLLSDLLCQERGQALLLSCTALPMTATVR